MEIINEAYFGKTKDVLAIEKAISGFRKKYLHKNDWDRYEMDEKINMDPDIHKINKAFEDAFGFAVCDFCVGFEVRYNAFTLPISNNFDVDDRKALIRTPTGYKFDKKADFAILIRCWYGLFASTKFTDAEITAILLHEVGHNFSGAVNNRIGIMQSINKSIHLVVSVLGLLILCPIPYMVFSNDFHKWFIDFKRKLVKENPNLAKLIETIRLWKALFQNFQNEIFFLQRLMSCVAIPLVMMNIIFHTLMAKVSSFVIPSNILRELYGYSDEKFADQFATMYGYGPELHSAMEKLSSGGDRGLLTQKMMVEGAPWLMLFYDLCTLPLMVILVGFDPHPAALERLESSIRALKTEAQYCRNPKMRARLERDIAVMEKEKEEWYTQATLFQKKNKQLDPGYFTKVYYATMFKIFGGDTRHLLWDKLFNSDFVLTTKADDEWRKGNR